MRMIVLSRNALALAAAALWLGACAAGESPAYTRGWADGCTSGLHDGHDPGTEYRSPFMKETGRYESEAQYRQAWDDAYTRCYALPYMMMIGTGPTGRHRQRPETEDRGAWENLS